MWSSMQGVAATLGRGHLLALRHEFSDDGNTEAQGLSDPPLFLLQIKRFTMVVLLVSLEAGELASSKGRGGPWCPAESILARNPSSLDMSGTSFNGTNVL